MGIARTASIAAAAFAFAAPAARAQIADELAVSGGPQHGAPKPWRSVRGFGRVLDLTKLPVVIDEPGIYAIDRSWQFSAAATAGNSELIHIAANGVTLDLHGFDLSADINAPPVGTLVMIAGNSAEIRNGGLSACCDGAIAVQGTGSNTRLHHLRIFSELTMRFDGESVSLTDSRLAPRHEIQFTRHSNLERNFIGCNRGIRCVRLLGDGNHVLDNRMALFQGGGIGVMGGDNVVADNVIDVSNAVDAGEVVEVDGRNNVVRGNTVLLGGVTSAIYVIGGTANTLDGNIAAPPSGATIPSEPARTGMLFTADGNYYGNNRMGAQVPFALGGTTQTDWGGNVGY